jgi:hypothetical protein
MSEASSLSNLKDIALPAEPGIWPLAPGLWLLIFFVIGIVAVSGLMLLNRHRRNAYRRAGLVLLLEVRTVYQLSVVLKRVALAAYPRELVASLHGGEWLAFLEKTCPGISLNQLLESEPESEADTELKESAGDWIRKHQADGFSLSEESQ